MDESIRPRTPDDDRCPWCTVTEAEVTGKCSACGREAKAEPVATEEKAHELQAG